MKTYDQNPFKSAAEIVEEKKKTIREEILIWEGEKETIVRSLKRLEGYHDTKLLQ